MLTLKLAFRNLFRNIRRTILTVMLIGFSLAALMVTDAVVTGMIDVMIRSITETLNGEAQVQHEGFSQTFDVDLYLPDSASIEQRIEDSAGVLAYAPRVVAGGMVASSYNVASGFIYGVDAERERQVSRISDAVIKGSYLSGQDGEILLGNELADLLEVELGDRIVLTLAEADTGELAQALFRVSGLLHFGLREVDESMVFINLDQGRQILALPNASHQIIVRFEDRELAADPSQPLYSLFSDNTDIEALSWLEANPDISSMIEMSRYGSAIVGSILFLLASLGVINSMFMSIYERIYEIGVAKAIGTRPLDLVALVLTEAGLIALVSCVFGLVVGTALNIWWGSHGIPLGEIEISGINLDNAIYAVMHPRQFTEFPVYVIILTLVASLYPARFASRINPASALQRSL